jgi:anti-sigma regulatory factor (Ser/Thr protein kinase)
VRPDGSALYLDRGRSLPVGVRPATTYDEAEYETGPGSTLLLYTDGLVERRGISLDDGLARLARSAGGGDDGPQGTCDRVLATMNPNGDDDVALLALESIKLGPQRLRITMPAERSVLGSFRRALGLWLKQCAVGDEESREIILASNEALANAIEHAYGPADGSVQMNAEFSEHEVSITVRDFGSWREPRGENRGRGLTLIEAVMDSVTVTKRPQEGTEVRMVRKVKGSGDGAA